MTNKKKILIILTVLIAITIGNIKSYANTGSNIIKRIPNYTKCRK